MANNSIFKKHIGFMLVFVLMIWVPHTKSIPFYTQDDNCIYGYDYEKPRNCTHGSYLINYNRKDCPSREFCYLGLGASCDPTVPETRCARDFTCMCGSCMNCNYRDCRMELCLTKNNLQKRWISPYEKNWLRLYNQGGNVAETGYYY